MRITPTEFDHLCRGQAVEERLCDGSWSLALVVGAQTELRTSGASTTVCLSAADIGRLSQDATEGVYFTSGGSRPIRYFIEKDFPCAHERPPQTCEPLTETFAPPPGFKARHQQ